MNPVEFRVLTADDAAAYSKVRLEALESDPTAFGSSPEEHRKLSESDIRARLSFDPAYSFVIGAFTEGAVVGTAGFLRNSNLKQRHKGRIWGVYLRSDLRGKGIGRRMMELLLERVVKVEGLEQVLINVTTTQVAATAMYRSLGFVPWAREARALKIEGRYIHEDYMMLELRK